MDINPRKAAGHDGIHGAVLKNYSVSLTKPLTFLYNISFVTGCIPVHKKGDKGSVENYRSISLISLVMQIFERCIKQELLKTYA